MTSQEKKERLTLAEQEIAQHKNICDVSIVAVNGPDIVFRELSTVFFEKFCAA